MPSTPAQDVNQIMVENNIRHLPVVGDGKRLAGLMTRQRLTMKPADISSLNVWEISRYLSALKVKDLMIKAPDVHTITPDRTVERAASLMTEHKIGCLPVVEDGDVVVGILSEIDLLKAFQAMLGLPSAGVRLTMRMPDRMGEFIKLAAVMIEHGWGIMGIGSFPSPRNPGFYDVVVKVAHCTASEVEEAVRKIPEQAVVDIREVV